MTEYYNLVSAARLPEVLARCEKIIEENLAKAGRAFKEIRDGKLYKESYPSFRQYCDGRWVKYGRQYIYRLIQATDIVMELSPMGDNLPERVVRELVSLPTPESRKEVMEEVLKGNPKPDYKDVRKVVEKKLVEILPATDKRVQKIQKKSIRSIEAFKKEFPKVWTELRNKYSDIPTWEIDAAAIKIIQNH